jgi:hypothetical protein
VSGSWGSGTINHDMVCDFELKLWKVTKQDFVLEEISFGDCKNYQKFPKSNDIFWS